MHVMISMRREFFKRIEIFESIFESLRPLHHAAERNNFNCADILIRRNANIEVKTNFSACSFDQSIGWV